MIDKFDGDYAFLSNFYVVDPPLQLHYWRNLDSLGSGKLVANTSEALYQAGKSKDPSSYKDLTAYQSKKKGRQETMSEEELKYWNKVKLHLMERILRLKFDDNHKVLQEKLLATGDEELVEGNTWNDTYWGICEGEGENHLGKLLMQIRKELKEIKESKDE